MYDIIIAGAGPAGISAALYAVSRGKKTLVLEKNEIGGLIGKVSTVTHFSPLVENETGKTFSDRMKAQAEQAGVEIRKEEVTGFILAGDIKKVTTASCVYETKAVILACGTTPRKLNIPGEKELAGKGIGLNAARNGADYAGKNIYVVGGADGAVKEALYLSKLAKKLTIIHFEDQLGAIPEFTEKVACSDNIELCLHSRLTAVSGSSQVDKLEITDEKTGQVKLIEDPGCGIFIYAGSAPNTELCGELSLKDGFIPVNSKMETDIPGVYAAGDICVKQVRQVATAVADGAVAGICAAAYCC